MAQQTTSFSSQKRATACFPATTAPAVAAPAAAPRLYHGRRQGQRQISVALATSSPIPTSNSPLLRSISIPKKYRGSAMFASGGDGANDGGGGEPSTPSPSIPSTPLSSSSSSSVSASSSSLSPPGAALAAAAATLGAILFAATRLSTGGVTLAAVAALSVPLDAALASGKPTIIEFYADYCDVCKALAPDSAAVARAYIDGGGGGADAPPPTSARSLNFVLLNADNARWAPEIAEYGVRGVPHFVFLGRDGLPRGAAVGRLPPGELEADAEDLFLGKPLSIGSRGSGAAPGGARAGVGEVTMLRGGSGAPAPRAHG